MVLDARAGRRRGILSVGALHLLFLLSPLSGVRAQTAGVSGTITDGATSRPVVDARVFVPGTSVGAFTDEDGRYVLSGLPTGEVILRVDRTGYATTDRTVLLPASQTVTVDFQLQVSAIALDGLVVTAAGTQRRRELGNAAAQIAVPDELRYVAPMNLSSLLQGRAAGVQILTNSGSVGTASLVRIRGNGSIAMGDTPLVYIDGARVSSDMQSGPDVGGQSTSRLNDLALDDIESIEIVKGPSAATLYGVEAAAGVIRITTKRGRAGQNQWTFRSAWGANWDATDWPITVWNPRADLGERVNVSAILPGAPTALVDVPDTLYSLDLLGGTSGYDAPWRTGYERTLAASLRGGSDAVTYFLSGEFRDLDGTLSNNESVQRSLRANFNLIPSPQYDLALSASYANNRVLLPNNDNSSFGYVGVGLLGAPWGTPITRTDLDLGGEVTTCPRAWEIHRAIHTAAVGTRPLVDITEDECPKNPFLSERTFDDVATISNVQDVDRFTTSFTAQYRPRSFLSTRATVGYDHFVDQTGFLVPVDPDMPFGDFSRGRRGTLHATNRLLTVDASAVATFDLSPELRSTTAVGAQFFRRKLETASASGRSLPVGSGTVSGAVRTTGSESISESRTLGLFVEEQIGFRDRLFVTPSIRFDDSSAFGKNLGRTAYPRVGVSYVVSEEGWFGMLNPGSFISDLRLRGSWGQSGRQPAAFAALKLLDARSVSLRGVDVSGLTLSGPGNPELKAERGEEIELGFEAGFFGGRLGVDFSFFFERTKDAIVGRTPAPSTGYGDPVFANIGELTNRGVEWDVGGLVLNGEQVQWEAGVIVNTVVGKITKLEKPIVYGLGGDSQRLQEGYPFGAYFSRIYQVTANGTVAESDSAVFVGQPSPVVDGSIDTSVSFRGWATFYANFGYAWGLKQFNTTEQFRCGFLGGGEYGGVCPQLFSTDADGDRTPEALVKAAASEDFEIGPWVESADFLRLRALSLRLELPRAWVERIGATNGNFVLSGENLLLFTRYSGLDPEVSFAGGDLTSRAEFFTLPPAKRVTGSVSISF